AIDPQVAHERELAHRLQGDRLGKVIHQGRAALPDLAVDDHRAGAADLFEAAAIPDRRRGRAAVGGRWICGDVLEAGDDVDVRPPRAGEIIQDVRADWD